MRGGGKRGVKKRSQELVDRSRLPSDHVDHEELAKALGSVVTAIWTCGAQAKKAGASNSHPTSPTSSYVFLGFASSEKDSNATKYIIVDNGERRTGFRGPSFEQVCRAYDAIQSLGYTEGTDKADLDLKDAQTWIITFAAIKKNIGTATAAFNSAAARARELNFDFGFAPDCSLVRDRYLDEYLPTHGRFVPFGGREKELSQLNEWLFDAAAPSRLLLTAPSGRGKTALLIEWVRHLPKQPQWSHAKWNLIFVPISIRADTMRPTDYLRVFESRLAQICGRPSVGSHGDAETLKERIRKDLADIATTDQPILIIVEGIDEATRGEFEGKLLPDLLPARLRIVASAREQFDAPSGEEWRRRLGWPEPVRVRIFPPLSLLDADALKAILIALENPSDEILGSEAIVRRVHELTEGEPILTRFYVEDLFHKTSDGARISVDQLPSMRPGFGGYFEGWWKQQIRLWEAERLSGVEIDQRSTERLVAILAHAKGPMEKADLAELCATINHEDRDVRAETLLRPLRRFVSGDGTEKAGFVLSHPKIGEHFRQVTFADLSSAVHTSFVTWGKKYLASLCGHTAPRRSRYAVRYLREHFVDGDASPEAWMLFVTPEWRACCERIEGTLKSFLGDLQSSVVNVSRSYGDQATSFIWRATLLRRPPRRRAIPTELCLAAFEANIFSSEQAAFHLTQFRSGALEVPAAIEPLLARMRAWPDQRNAMALDIFRETISAARSIEPKLQALVLEESARLLPYVRDDIRKDTEHLLLLEIEKITDVEKQFSVLTSVLMFLSAEGRSLAASRALAIYKVVGEPAMSFYEMGEEVSMLAVKATRLLPHVPHDERRVLLEEWGLKFALPSEGLSPPDPTKLSSPSQTDEQQEKSRKALEIASAEQDEQDRIDMFGRLLPVVTSSDREVILNAFLSNLDSEFYLPQELVCWMDELRLPSLFDEVKHVFDYERRLAFMTLISERIRGTARERIIRETLDAYAASPTTTVDVSTVISLAFHSPHPHRAHFVKMGIAGARGQRTVEAGLKYMIQLAPCIDDVDRKSAVEFFSQAIRNFSVERRLSLRELMMLHVWRLPAFDEVGLAAIDCSLAFLDEVLPSVESAPHRSQKIRRTKLRKHLHSPPQHNSEAIEMYVSTMVGLVSGLDMSDRQPFLVDAKYMAYQIEHNVRRIRLLAMIGQIEEPEMSERTFAEAFALASTIKNVNLQAIALRVIARYVTPVLALRSLRAMTEIAMKCDADTVLHSSPEVVRLLVILGDNAGVQEVVQAIIGAIGEDCLPSIPTGLDVWHYNALMRSTASSLGP